MWDFLQKPAAQAVIWCAVLACLLIFSFYVVIKFRGRAVNDNAPSSDLLTNFREMHQQGDISETEFRKIKTMLGTKLQGELGSVVEKQPDRPDGLQPPERSG